MWKMCPVIQTLIYQGLFYKLNTLQIYEKKS